MARRATQYMYEYKLVTIVLGLRFILEKLHHLLTKKCLQGWNIVDYRHRLQDPLQAELERRTNSMSIIIYLDASVFLRFAIIKRRLLFPFPQPRY